MTTQLSWKIVTTANCSWSMPFEAQPIVVWNEVVGQAITTTICGTVNAGALPNNDDIWAEFEYLGDGGTAAVFASYDGVPSAGVALSNSNLTVTATASLPSAGGRSASVRTTGKYYFEVSRAGTHGDYHQQGVLTSSGSYGDALAGSNAFSAWKNGQIYTHGGASPGNMGVVVPGDIVCIAIDLDNRMGWARRNNGNWNGSGTANPATNVGGGALLPTVGYSPYVEFGNGAFVGESFTGNFGGSGFAYAVPLGFTPGWMADPLSPSPRGFFATTTKSDLLATPAAVASDGSGWGIPTYTVFNAGTATGISLTNNNLTGTVTTNSSNLGVRSIDYKSSGKYYFEVTINVLNAVLGFVAILRSDVGYSTGATGVAYVPANNGSIGVDGASTGNTVGNFVVGDVIGIAMDLGSGKFWARRNAGLWNGQASYNPATGVGHSNILDPGSYSPGLMYGTSSVGNAATANFGQSAFAFTPPTGFVAWTASWSLFKLASTITPKLPGWIYARVRAGKPSATYYVDPKVTVEAVPYTPPPTAATILTGLVGWWDASVLTSFSLTGSLINSVADQSGNNQTMLRAGWNPPTYNAMGLNGKPAIMFGPTATVAASLVTDYGFPMGTGNTLTAFAVATLTDPSNHAGNSDSRIVCYAKPGASDWDNTGSWVFSRDGYGTNICLTRNSIEATPRAPTTYTIPHRYITTVKSDGTIVVYIDGVATPASTANGGNWVSGGRCAIAVAAYNVGINAGTNYWEGAFSEVGVATGYSDAATVAALDLYLKTKWQPAFTVVPPGASSESAAFLARSFSLNATHINAYMALIDGLVADGVWAKLDVLHIYATQNHDTALVNLVSASYEGRMLGALLPAFTVDRGFVGGNDDTSAGIDTTFNPVTAVSPKHVRNSSHISAWSLTNRNSIIEIVGANTQLGWITGILTRRTDNNAYFYCNTSTNTSVAVADSIGHYIANRPNSTTTEGYKNGSVIVTNSSSASTAPDSLNIFAAGYNISTTGMKASANQIAMMSIGSSLSSTEATNFYNRLRTYMTAVGVP